MDFEAVMAWVLVGTIAGYVAGLVLEGRGHGMAAAIGLGNAGAVVAGAVLPRLGIFGGLDLFSNVMSATAGALALLIAAAMIRRP